VLVEFRNWDPPREVQASTNTITAGADSPLAIMESRRSTVVRPSESGASHSSIRPPKPCNM